MTITEKDVCLKNLKDMQEIALKNMDMIRTGNGLEKIYLDSLLNSFYINAYSVAEHWKIKHELNPNNPFYIWADIFDTQKHPGKVVQKTAYYQCLTPEQIKKFEEPFIETYRGNDSKQKKKIRAFLFTKFCIPFIHLSFFCLQKAQPTFNDYNFVYKQWNLLYAFSKYLHDNFDTIDQMSLTDRSQPWKHFAKYVADNDPNYNKN